MLLLHPLRSACSPVITHTHTHIAVRNDAVVARVSIRRRLSSYSYFRINAVSYYNTGSLNSNSATVAYIKVKS
jgi:hypothetical protein